MGSSLLLLSKLIICVLGCHYNLLLLLSIEIEKLKANITTTTKKEATYANLKKKRLKVSTKS